MLGVLKFERMPFLAIVKEAKMRGFVSPGELLTIEANADARAAPASAVTEAKSTRRRQGSAAPNSPSRLLPFPMPALRVHMDALAERDRLSATGDRHD